MSAELGGIFIITIYPGRWTDCRGKSTRLKTFILNQSPVVVGNIEISKLFLTRRHKSGFDCPAKLRGSGTRIGVALFRRCPDGVWGDFPVGAFTEKVLERFFYASVFSRMKGNYRQPPARRQKPDGLRQNRPNIAEFIINRYP